MFTAALENAKKCINAGMEYKEYVSTLKQSTLIEYVDVIIVDEDAYNRLQTIMNKVYLK